MNLQHPQSSKESGNATDVIDCNGDLVELTSKGVATVVVIYRHSRCAFTHRIASHVLKHTITSMRLGSRTVPHSERSGVPLAMYVAAGLKLIAGEATETRIMESAKAAGEVIEVALEQSIPDIQARLARLSDVWAEELANTPEVEYVHTMAIDDSNFLTHLARAELAMIERIRADIG